MILSSETLGDGYSFTSVTNVSVTEVNLLSLFVKQGNTHHPDLLEENVEYTTQQVSRPPTENSSWRLAGHCWELTQNDFRYCQTWNLLYIKQL